VTLEGRKKSVVKAEGTVPRESGRGKKLRRKKNQRSEFALARKERKAGERAVQKTGEERGLSGKGEVKGGCRKPGGKGSGGYESRASRA